MTGITFGSVCSGIEAASVAWHPFGWRAAWLAEIEPFPCAVLAHHYPEVPNLGDMTKIAAMLRHREIPVPDVLCGGTPCQAFSVAGLRRSLDDARGNLSLTFCEIADEIDARRAADGAVPCVVVWENVPGVLNTKDNAFGCFLAGLAGEDDPLVPAGGKWTDAGCVLGPQRTVAWRVLDAQYFGLAQRRRRVFVVASAREGFDPAAVLFEFDGVRRDSAPRREAGQDAAAGTLRGTDGGSDVDHGRAGHLQPVRIERSTEAAPPIAAPVYSVALRGRDGGATAELGGDVAGTLRASGGGGDKAHVLAPVLSFKPGQSEAAGGIFVTEDFTPTLQAQNNGSTAVPAVAYAQALAFSCKDHGADASVELAPTMRAMGHSGSHANAGGQLAVVVHGTQDPCTSDIAFALGRNNGQENAVCVTGDITHTLKAEGFDASEDGAGRGQPIVAINKDNYASTQEGNAAQALHALREEIGAEAFAMWRLGVADSFQPAEVLRHNMHGQGVRCEADEAGRRMDGGTLPCPESGSARGLPEVREAGRQRRTPQGRGLPEQLARELDSALSKLPHEGAPPAWVLHDLCAAGERAGVLQPALSAVQGWPLAVRRLTPRECERLMGFPDDYTLIPVRSKPAADGPRYKALGNSWAINCVSWLGARINRALKEAA